MSRGSEIHKGHRKRMRERFKRNENGILDFEDHEKLEMFLFFCYTRQNTNEIAHELLNEFGSFIKIFTSAPDDLCRINQVNRAVAERIRFYGELALSLDTEYNKDNIFYSEDFIKNQVMLNSTGESGMYLIYRTTGGDITKIKFDDDSPFNYNKTTQVLIEKNARIAATVHEIWDEEYKHINPLFEKNYCFFLQKLLPENEIQFAGHYQYKRGKFSRIIF